MNRNHDSSLVMHSLRSPWVLMPLAVAAGALMGALVASTWHSPPDALPSFVGNPESIVALAPTDDNYVQQVPPASQVFAGRIVDVSDASPSF